MAITKTNFINFTRCPRYLNLDRIKKEGLANFLSFDEYQAEEEKEKVKEILGSMYEIDEEDNEIDLIDIDNPQLKAMLPYYKKTEDVAGKYIEKKFPGFTVYNEATFKQKEFAFTHNDIKYQCFLDIYNESTNEINVVEVKATTSNKYKKLGSTEKFKDRSIFDVKDNIMFLKDEINGCDIESEFKINDFNKYKEKLFDRYDECGKYIYDIAIQRFFIEKWYQENNIIIPKINYYLAVLNHQYVFDGTYINGEAVYNQDINGHDIIILIDVSKLTRDYQEKMAMDMLKLESYLDTYGVDAVPLGRYCEFKKQTQCKFFHKVCGKNIPKENSSLNYLNNGQGFKDEAGNRHKGLELINEGYLQMLDIPEAWINSSNHHIQRDALRFNQPYIDKEKIKIMLNNLAYPIYHLDFETFPCPLPRYKGEKCYTQSPFEFSLHIETSPGICDKEKDNYVFLASSHEDEREDLVKKLCELIPGDKGTLFAQNVSFERGRIKELADIFPTYREQLLKIVNNYFDLIYLLKTKKDFFMELGYDEETAKKVNFYDQKMSGSYSIKKTLPIFSNLNYADLEIHNGVEALVEYANYDSMNEEEFNLKYEALKEYCKQDTWAMVEILNGLRELVK